MKDKEYMKQLAREVFDCEDDNELSGEGMRSVMTLRLAKAIEHSNRLVEDGRKKIQE